jgi:hypothetical protein
MYWDTSKGNCSLLRQMRGLSQLKQPRHQLGHGSARDFFFFRRAKLTGSWASKANHAGSGEVRAIVHSFSREHGRWVGRRRCSACERRGRACESGSIDVRWGEGNELSDEKEPRRQHGANRGLGGDGIAGLDGLNRSRTDAVS